MISIKSLYNIDSLHVICYTLLVAVTWLSGSKEEGLVEIVMLFE